jgi:hypothetical protein
MRCQSCGLVFADETAQKAHYPCNCCAFCLAPVTQCVQTCDGKYHPSCYVEITRGITTPWLIVRTFLRLKGGS